MCLHAATVFGVYCVESSACLQLSVFSTNHVSDEKEKAEAKARAIAGKCHEYYLNVSVNIFEFAVMGLQVRCCTVDVIIRMFTQEPVPQLEPV